MVSLFGMRGHCEIVTASKKRPDRLVDERASCRSCSYALEQVARREIPAEIWFWVQKRVFAPSEGTLGVLFEHREASPRLALTGEVTIRWLSSNNV